MGFPIMVRWHIYIESGPRLSVDKKHPSSYPDGWPMGHLRCEFFFLEKSLLYNGSCLYILVNKIYTFLLLAEIHLHNIKPISPMYIVCFCYINIILGVNLNLSSIIPSWDVAGAIGCTTEDKITDFCFKTWHWVNMTIVILSRTQ